MGLFGSYQRRSTTLAIVGSSQLGFAVQVRDTGDGDGGKSINNPLGPIVRLTIKIQSAAERVRNHEKEERDGRNT